jgi:hypothetical protein
LTGVGGRSLCRWDEKTGGPRENGERKGEAKGEAKGEEDGRRPLRPSGGNRGELAENRFLWTPDNGVCKEGLLRVRTSHRLCLHMELVLLGLVQTLHRPQLSFVRHPSHFSHRFRRVRLGFLVMSGDWESPEVVPAPGLSPGVGGGGDNGSAFSGG